MFLVVQDTTLTIYEISFLYQCQMYTNLLNTNKKLKVTTAVVLLVACITLVNFALGDDKSITPAQLAIRINQENPPVVLDVRSRAEYEAGHIKSAIHKSFFKTLFGLHELQAAKDSELVLYCQHGPRAGLAKIGLRLTGYKNLRYLKGHMSGWNKLDLPVTTIGE